MQQMSEIPRNRLSVEGTVRAALAAHQAGKMAEADRLYSIALATDSRNPAALHFAGLFAYQRGDNARAMDLLRRATKAAPEIAEAHSNLAAVLRASGHLDEALRECEQAMRLQPGYFAGTLNLAAALLATGQAARAVDVLRTALQSRAMNDGDPVVYAAWSNLLMAMQYDARQTPGAVAREHRRFGELLAKAVGGAKAMEKSAARPERLRIGYVSPDFRDHAAMSFFEPILRHHDRKRFEIVCYADVPRSDAVTARIRGHADVWREITGLSHTDAAQKIAGEGVHVLVDLAGHTSGNRLPMFARRAAPVQVSYLGYPCTTGVTAIDYRITDALADPPGRTQDWHTERLVRLPTTAWCYEPPASAPEPAEPPAVFTYACFAQLAKITPASIEMWSRILRGAPEARLLIKSRGLEDPGTRDRWLRFLADGGIDASRCELRGGSFSYADHLSAHEDASVVLDTFLYHGTTTTCEALWMGAPVVTLAGESHVSRVGVSLLTTVGRAEWIGKSPDEYVEIATQLYENRDALAGVRSSLRQQMRESGLLNAARFTGELESLYDQIWAGRIIGAD
jgi:protein O-GlcNAc transferase